MHIEAFPARVVLELTPRCNLSCPMCPRHLIGEHDGYMSGALFTRLVDEIVEIRPDAVLLPFWRGESCMHPAFAELVGYALDRGLRVHLATNGHYAAPEMLAVFYRCEFLTVSVHTRRGFENARRILAGKPATSGTTIQASFVDCEYTTSAFLEECLATPDLAGFDSVRLFVEHSVDGTFGKSRLAPQGERGFCPKLSDTLVVGADGRYSRCNHIWVPESDGDLHQRSIAEVWSGTRMQAIRSGYPDRQCAPCDQWRGNTNGESWRRGPGGEVLHRVYGGTSHES